MAPAREIDAASTTYDKAIAHANPINIQKSLMSLRRIGLSAVAQLHAWLDQYHARPALAAVTM
jgi:hypothetical protein